MGLSIHYELHATAARNLPEARDLVRELHRRAKESSFASVGDLVELSGHEIGDYKFGPETDPMLRWLLVQADLYVKHADMCYGVRPYHLVAFTTDPGEGSEVANFGLAIYPDEVEVEREEQGRKIEEIVPTGAIGWQWYSFCKTQYASNPRYGGAENFLNCHKRVVGLLDQAQALGLVKQVVDEGGYWQHRDDQALTREVERWNYLLAGLAGRVKDLLGQKVEAPIMDYPNFERLEVRRS